MEREKMADKRDYYEVLGVSKTASEAATEECIPKISQEISSGRKPGR